MITRTIGSSGITVPAIGLGTAGFGLQSGAKSNFGQAAKIVRMAVNLGVSFIDTAEAYENGNSERVVGEGVRGIRDNVIIATKFSPEHSSPERLLEAIEGSLRRLQTDRIDLYQMHWSNPSVPIGKTLGALEKLIDGGKIGLIGLCNSSLKELNAAQDSLSSASRLATVQNEYNLLERSCEQGLLAFCHEKRITFVAHSPLGHGSVIGKDRRVSRLVEIAKEYNVSVSQLALSWVIKDGQSIAIPRTMDEQHLRENIAVLDIKIDKKDYEAISSIFEPKIIEIPTKLVEIPDKPARGAYQTLGEAIANRHGFVPGPMKLAEEIRSGEKLKLIKVRLRETQTGQRYVVLEGRMRYWAWVIAYGYDVPIPAIVEYQQ